MRSVILDTGNSGWLSLNSNRIEQPLRAKHVAFLEELPVLTPGGVITVTLYALRHVDFAGVRFHNVPDSPAEKPGSKKEIVSLTLQGVNLRHCGDTKSMRPSRKLARRFTSGSNATANVPGMPCILILNPFPDLIFESGIVRRVPGKPLKPEGFDLVR